MTKAASFLCVILLPNLAFADTLIYGNRQYTNGTISFDGRDFGISVKLCSGKTKSFHLNRKQINKIYINDKVDNPCPPEPGLENPAAPGMTKPSGPFKLKVPRLWWRVPKYSELVPTDAGLRVDGTKPSADNLKLVNSSVKRGKLTAITDESVDFVFEGKRAASTIARESVDFIELGAEKSRK